MKLNISINLRLGMTKKALIIKPRKGFVFLESLKEGVSFTTEGGLEGTVIKSNEGSVLCYFTKYDCKDDDNKKYWLNNHKRIAPKTNVKKKGS